VVFDQEYLARVGRNGSVDAVSDHRQTLDLVRADLPRAGIERHRIEVTVAFGIALAAIGPGSVMTRTGWLLWLGRAGSTHTFDSFECGLAPLGESKVEGGKSRQAKLKLTSSVASDPVAEQVQKGPEYCPGLIVCRTIDN
jgi:hypothetical protein